MEQVKSGQANPMVPSFCVIMGSICISHEPELCQRSQITQENGQAFVASIIYAHVYGTLV